MLALLMMLLALEDRFTMYGGKKISWAWKGFNSWIGSFFPLSLWYIHNYCVAVTASPVMVRVSGSGGAQTAGEVYTLTCTVTGGSATTYQWFKNDLTIPDQTSTLSFAPLRQTDSGNYSCQALNIRSISMGITVEGNFFGHHCIYIITYFLVQIHHYQLS